MEAAAKPAHGRRRADGAQERRELSSAPLAAPERWRNRRNTSGSGANSSKTSAAHPAWGMWRTGWGKAAASRIVSNAIGAAKNIAHVIDRAATADIMRMA